MTVIYDSIDPLFQVITYLVAAFVAYRLGTEIVATSEQKEDGPVTQKATLYAVPDPGSKLNNTLASSDQAQENEVSLTVNASNDYEEGWLQQLAQEVLTMSSKDDEGASLSNAIQVLKEAVVGGVQEKDWEPVTTRVLRRVCPILGISGLSSKPKADMIAAVVLHFKEPQAQPT